MREPCPLYPRKRTLADGTRTPASQKLTQLSKTTRPRSKKACFGSRLLENVPALDWCMTSYFSALVDFVHAHSQYTHIAIFLLALSEAIPVVGAIVPGSTLIIGISALATGANADPSGFTTSGTNQADWAKSA